MVSRTSPTSVQTNQLLSYQENSGRAKEIGIPESKIQMWFQNQRSLYPGQSGNESINSLADGPNGRPGLTAQQHQINLSTLLGRSHHFASSSSFSRNQTFLSAPLPSRRDLSDTQTPFWLPNQEKCQNQKEQTGTGILQGKDYSEPCPEHQEHQLQDLEQVDILYVLQQWDEVCQTLIAKWDP
ncbi:hypothetical protein PANDA_017572 [Ailuropoda melanoleuca]|uniref:Homeobox domain-containing protein n=1 Tax=Ailuropoda melanoleuca TaxID=9646 RepID=D2HY18_AILME|nr:hypothetical protein PANDA_017572 [Ailuropoda melanoleuca]